MYTKYLYLRHTHLSWRVITCAHAHFHFALSIVDDFLQIPLKIWIQLPFLLQDKILWQKLNDIAADSTY